MVQSWNGAAVATIGRVLRRPALVLPHLAVPTLNDLSAGALHARGIRGVLLDKDNTITAPYVDELHPRAAAGLAELQAKFPGRVAILSNSAGLRDYDPLGEEADRLERAMGVPVLRHSTKKPMPTPAALAEVLAHFNGNPPGGTQQEWLCEELQAHEICVVGDRLLTDVLFGNIHGLYTVHLTSVLSLKGDNTMARLFRNFESGMLGPVLRAAGYQPPPHGP